MNVTGGQGFVLALLLIFIVFFYLYTKKKF